MADAGGGSDHQALGTVLVVLAAFTFALVALVVNSDPLPILVATEARFLVCWMLSAFCMLRFRTSLGLHWFGPPELRKLLLLRAVLSFSFQTLWWYSLQRVPFGNGIAITYCSPVLCSIWSELFLGEKPPLLFPIQALLSILGTLLIVDPPFLHSEDLGSSVPMSAYTPVFAALLVCSINPVVTRQTRACSWIEVEHVCAFVACLVLNPLLLASGYVLFGEVPSLSSSDHVFKEVGLILAAAVGAFGGLAMETKGYQLAEVGKASMFRYLEVPFAYILQVACTSKPATSHALAGSALILLCVSLGPLSRHLQAKQAAATQTAATEGLLAKQGAV